MTPAAPDSAATELEPVRRALLDRAHAEASVALSTADADVAARLASARAEATSIREAARVQGEADAASSLRGDLVRARRQARTTVLRAEQEAYDELCRRSRDAVRRLRVEPAYRELLDAMTGTVRRRLGPDAVVSEHPEGGLQVEAPGTFVDLSLDSLTEEAIGALRAGLAGLWSP